MDEPVPTQPPVTVTDTTITVEIPEQPTPTSTTITQPPQVVEKISEGYIYAIIIIGAVLVIAVIILIVRTRRSV
jgi:NADH:ubiquinone oxidoreductase subunit 6 (subunit J)